LREILKGANPADITLAMDTFWALSIFLTRIWTAPNPKS
jgi:hypothetical protein